MCAFLLRARGSNRTFMELKLKNAVQTELKSAYFETKYNRPLRLNEFAAVVVPDNLGEDVRKGIENAGLPSR